MKHTVRVLSICLAALTLFLSACAGNGGDDGKNGISDPAVRPEEMLYTEENGYRLAVNDYKGATCCVCLGTLSGMDAAEETGEGLNDATYRRNEKVRELYNVDLTFPELGINSEDYYVWIDYLYRTIMAGDDTYQLIGGYSHWMSAETLKQKQYQNLLDLPYLDFDQPWWPSKYQERSNLGGALYITVGNTDTSFYDQACAMLFNKSMADELQIGGLYDLVKEGKWTLDRLKEYSAMAELDLNGDGRMTQEDDRFGLTVYRNTGVDAFVMAFGEFFTAYDENGLPQLLPLSDHYVDMQVALEEFIIKRQDTLYSKVKDTAEFLEGRSLFEGTDMRRAVQYRAMDNDFGILPYPMWDENQDGYHTHHAVGGATAFCIPVTTNGDMPANILEALCYLGYKNVKPVYYDKTLKGKLVRDAESGEMLDLIYDSIDYNFVQIYSHYFDPSPDLLLRLALYDGKSMSAEWTKRQRMYDTKMKELLDMLS